MANTKSEVTISSYLSDFVYGGIDGSVTTFAIVAGVTGASLSPTIVLILGFANLFADGFSMAVGNYLSTKSRKQYADKVRKSEEHSIINIPEEETQEIRDIFMEKGFSGNRLDDAVDIITSNKKVWVDTMMKDEFGIFEDHSSPLKSALVTFVSFNLIGFIPLFAYVLSYFSEFFRTNTFTLSVIFTSIAFIIVGSVKGRIVGSRWFFSSFETLLIGGAAAVIAYYVGYLLRGLA
ncbi:MAG: membrane protein [Thermodesulfobacteriota bacterium]|nr:MAG: membrane protein [Thermodesulfobacteriota bacterium]